MCINLNTRLLLRGGITELLETLQSMPHWESSGYSLCFQSLLLIEYMYSTLLRLPQGIEVLFRVTGCPCLERQMKEIGLC
jgi:hypothetical protein